uniref:Uncharacterized protein n=1 Tax=Anguilla anguilla TaxID=7936 RepID=A0A0E9TTA6_ANGAN
MFIFHAHNTKESNKIKQKCYIKVFITKKYATSKYPTSMQHS